MTAFSKTTRAAALYLSISVLVGCANMPDTPGAAQNVETISFALDPCYGFCPHFALSVDGQGSGTYDGRNFVAQRGAHTFEVSEAQFAAFRDRLAPFRPDESVSYGYDNCAVPVATDSPSVHVTWRDADGSEVTLDWYMGCRQTGLAERSNEIYKAWQELPVEHLVGADEDRASYRPQ